MHLTHLLMCDLSTPFNNVVLMRGNVKNTQIRSRVLKASVGQVLVTL